MNREVHVRLREGLRGKFPRSTRLERRLLIAAVHFNSSRRKSVTPLLSRFLGA